MSLVNTSIVLWWLFLLIKETCKKKLQKKRGPTWKDATDVTDAYRWKINRIMKRFVICTSFKYQVSCYFIHETLKFLIIATGFSNHSSYAYVNRNKMPQEKITINHNKKSQETFKSSHVKNVVFFSHIMLRPLLVMHTQDLLCSDRW